MNTRLLSLIPDYLLGVLPDSERFQMDALVVESAAFEREVDRVAESLASSAEPLVSPSPPDSVRSRLLDTLGTSDRFAPFFDDLIDLFQLPHARIRALLARIDGLDWETSLLGVPLEGARLFHFLVGPVLAAAGAAGGIVRIAPDVTFPRHSHHGREVTYVLEGGYCVDGGRVHHPGAALEMAGESRHSYRSAPGRDLVLAVLHHGIAFG